MPATFTKYYIFFFAINNIANRICLLFCSFTLHLVVYYRHIRLPLQLFQLMRMTHTPRYPTCAYMCLSSVCWFVYLLLCLWKIFKTSTQYTCHLTHTQTQTQNCTKTTICAYVCMYKSTATDMQASEAQQHWTYTHIHTHTCKRNCLRLMYEHGCVWVELTADNSWIPRIRVSELSTGIINK